MVSADRNVPCGYGTLSYMADATKNVVGGSLDGYPAVNQALGSGAQTRAPGGSTDQAPARSISAMGSGRVADSGRQRDGRAGSDPSGVIPQSRESMPRNGAAPTTNAAACIVVDVGSNSRPDVENHRGDAGSGVQASAPVRQAEPNVNTRDPAPSMCGSETAFPVSWAEEVVSDAELTCIV